MSSALEEAQRIAQSVAKQHSHPGIRRALLTKAQQVDVLQTFAMEGRLSPPTMLWRVPEGPVLVLADWSRDSAHDGGWRYHEVHFNADGVEVDETGAPVPGGRILVVPTLTPKQAHEAREAQFSRWTRALDDREKAYGASLPEWLQHLISGKWMEEALRVDDPKEHEQRAAQEILDAIPMEMP